MPRGRLRRKRRLSQAWLRFAVRPASAFVPDVAVAIARLRARCRAAGSIYRCPSATIYSAWSTAHFFGAAFGCPFSRMPAPRRRHLWSVAIPFAPAANHFAWLLIWQARRAFAGWRKKEEFRWQ